MRTHEITYIIPSSIPIFKQKWQADLDVILHKMDKVQSKISPDQYKGLSDIVEQITSNILLLNDHKNRVTRYMAIQADFNNLNEKISKIESKLEKESKKLEKESEKNSILMKNIMKNYKPLSKENDQVENNYETKEKSTRHETKEKPTRHQFCFSFFSYSFSINIKKNNNQFNVPPQIRNSNRPGKRED